MSFYKKYELERLIADGEVKTFRAKESSTGRIVFLHLFNPGSQALLADLKGKLLGPGGKPMPPLLEFGEFAGNPYAVTDSSEAFSGLREWVSQQPDAIRTSLPEAPRPAPAPAPRLVVAPAASPLPALPPEEPGEFTRLFGSVAAQPKPPAPAPSQAPVPSPHLLDDASREFGQMFPSSQPTPAAERPLPQEELGDFTRAFGPPQLKAAGIAKPPVREQAPYVPLAPPAPPEPRRAPESPKAPEPSRAPDDWAPPADTGAFTKLFGSGLSGEAIDIASEQAKAARTGGNDSRPFQKAGEFTRMFGPDLVGGDVPVAPPAVAPLSLNTAASGIFGRSLDPPPVPRSGAELPVTPGAAAEPGQQGEYTRVFGEQTSTVPSQRPPEPKKPLAVVPIAAQPVRRRMPAIVVGVIATVLVLLVLILAAVLLSKR